MRLSPSTAISLAALVIALGGTGYAANGGSFLLGLFNSATQGTALTANFNGSALQLTNTSAGASATALELTIGAGHPPMKVNGATKVTNLNADYLDGFSSAAFVPAAIGGWHYVGDPGEPAFEGTWVNTNGGTHLTATSQHLAFRIDNNHVVHIQGRVKDGSLGATIFILPAAYCPKYFKSFAVTANSAFAEIIINNAGGGPACAVKHNAGATTTVMLDVSFPDATTDALIAAGP